MVDYEQEVLRGRQAKELLEHPLLVDAFAALEKEVLDAWKSSPARDAEGREKLWLMLHLSGKVRMHLTQVIETGQMAQISLKQLEQRSLLNKAGIL